MFCEKCGNHNLDGSTFCSFCGSPLNKQPVQQMSVKKKNKWPLLIVSVFLLLALVAGTIFVVFSITSSYGNKDIEKCLENFEKSYNNSDIDGMIECLNDDTQGVVNAALGLSSEIFGVDTSKILNIILGFGSDLSGYDNLNIEVENITKETKTSAIADTTFDFGDKKFEISLTLTKEDDNWVISGIK